jgi:hypothetical protein
MTLFDIVIPVGPNDRDVITKQLEYTKKNIVGYRNIYLIYIDNSLSVDGCITIPETIFPFSIKTVADLHGASGRNGWYLQQIIKLYAGLVIPDILPQYLVIDADTFFLTPTSFYINNKPCYNYGSEYHIPYFIHMSKLHPTFKKQLKESGICHHMMFETCYIREIFALVEQHHKEPFYNTFLRCVTEYTTSGASEYELYFNYMIAHHPTAITIRPLRWANTRKLIVDSNYDYISYHCYMREITPVE